MQDFFANCATVLQKYGFSYLRGAGTTLLLALVGTFFGCLIGFAVGALQTIPVDKQRDPVWKRVLLKILHIFLRCYVELFRGTPMIVQLSLIHILTSFRSVLKTCDCSALPLKKKQGTMASADFLQFVVTAAFGFSYFPSARPPRVRTTTFLPRNRHIYRTGFGQHWTLCCTAHSSVPIRPTM